MADAAQRLPAAAATAAGLTPLPLLRQRVRSLLARPVPPGLAPPRLLGAAADQAGGLWRERWRLQSEAGALGDVPVLCVSPAPPAARRRPAVVFLHGTGSRKEDLAPQLKRCAWRHSLPQHAALAGMQLPSCCVRVQLYTQL